MSAREASRTPAPDEGLTYRPIHEQELQARFAKLCAEKPIIRSLCNHNGYGLEGLLAEFAERNPKLRGEVLAKLRVREVTIYVDAEPVQEGGAL